MPAVAAYLLDTKWVIAAGATALMAVLIGIEQRLYDLCIRVRRTKATLLGSVRIRARRRFLAGHDGGR
jgi:hypothetical protein